MANPNPIVPIAHQFKPGNPGGPGAPRKRAMTEAYEDILRAEIPEKMRTSMNAGLGHEVLKKHATWADAIAFGIAKRAVTGDPAAAKDMGDRTEGKPAQRIEVSNPMAGRFQVAVTYAQPIKTIEARRELVEQVEDKILQDAIETAVVEAVNQDENE